MGSESTNRERVMAELVLKLREFLVAEGREGDRKVYHFLLPDNRVLEIVL
jgi:hypothetical protein